MVIGPSDRNRRRWGMTGQSVIDEAPASTSETKVTKTIERVGVEVNKMSAKKVPICEAINQVIYSDTYGLVSLSICGIKINDGKGKEITERIYFSDQRGNYYLLRDRIAFFMANDWDTTTSLYIMNPLKKNNYWGSYDHLQPGSEQALEFASITVMVQYGSDAHREELKFKSKKEMDKYFVLVSETGFQKKHPLLGEIKVGEKYYYEGMGTVMVDEIYPYPQRNNHFCKVSNSSGVTRDIGIDCTNFYFLPTESRKSVLSVLDESVNELALFPYVVKEDKNLNVYWKPIEEAAEYIVSLYRVITFNGEKDLYHLSDYVVDRNECFFSIDGLIGATFIVRVTAENRNGEVIAKSRGMEKGMPQFFTRDEE